MVEQAVSARRAARGGVLVLGGGFAGAWVTRLLGRRGATIVSPDNFMLFTPLLPEAASGTLEPRHAVVPLRMMCPHAELVLGRATGLDAESCEVVVETDVGHQTVTYDALVIAVGSIARSLPVPGLAEHAVGQKTLADAIYLRNHVLRELEDADAEPDPDRVGSHLSFVFVGAGYAGVETLAELHDLVRGALRYYPRLRDARQRWLLVDAADRILHETPEHLGSYAARQLERRGIEVRHSTRLQSVQGGVVELDDGERLEAHTIVWTAGVKANPVLAGFGLPLDDAGRVRVDRYLRVESHDRIWALGDCARVPNEATPDRIDPPTSQHALRQARRIASNLAATLDHRPLRPHSYHTRGQVATLGRNKGIAVVYGVRVSGFLGWFLARTYHVYQLPLFSRKLRVVTDWTVSLFFRRDVSDLGTLGRPERLEP